MSPSGSLVTPVAMSKTSPPGPLHAWRGGAEGGGEVRLPQSAAAIPSIVSPPAARRAPDQPANGHGGSAVTLRDDHGVRP